MPHLFVNRGRRHCVAKPQASADDHHRWERINGIAYNVGGVVFIAGSVLFFPSFEAYADLGVTTFILGSLIYLVVTGHDLIEAIQHKRSRSAPEPSLWMELIAAVGYLAGTCFFAVGSVLFLSWVGLFTAGAWFFVIGSLLFVLGAAINMLQIVRAADLLTLQLMNLTAATFLVGSVLFVVGSIPYLWTIQSGGDRRLVDSFLAWQYVAGSILFLAGGVFSYWRAYAFAAPLLERLTQAEAERTGRPR